MAIRADETDADTLALWLEITGVANGQYTYDMWFQAQAEAKDDDAVVEGELPIVIEQPLLSKQHAVGGENEVDAMECLGGVFRDSVEGGLLGL